MFAVEQGNKTKAPDRLIFRKTDNSLQPLNSFAPNPAAGLSNLILSGSRIGNLQAKLTVGAPNNHYEKEADSMADKVMTMPESGFGIQRQAEEEEQVQTKTLAGEVTPLVQRQAEEEEEQVQAKCAECEEEEQVQKKEEDEEEKVQTKTEEDEEKPVQTKQLIQAECAECDNEEKVQQKREIQRKPNTNAVSNSVESGLNSSKGGGTTLNPQTQTFMESRFGADFSGVRIHNDSNAVQMSKSLNAQAFTHGSDIYFNSGKYDTNSSSGKHLLAHELTHTIQQGSSKVQKKIQKAPRFPDTTCDSVTGNIQRAWPTALDWVREAIHRLQNPAGAADLLQTHFRIDPNNTAHQSDLQLVISNFNRMAEILQSDVDCYCTTPAASGSCFLPDGRIYAAYVRRSGHPEQGIYFCMNAAGAGFLGGENLIEHIVHEVAHAADPQSTDYSYRHSAVNGTTYEQLTRQQTIHNGDCYSEFANDVYAGGSVRPSVVPSLSAGVLLSGSSPTFVVRVGSDLRSRSGIEVFDLIGGFRLFFGVDGTATRTTIGGSVDVGVLSRSPSTGFFADVRTGGFYSASFTGGTAPSSSAGISASTILGWADSRFRFALDTQMLFDLLSGNHAVIIGGQFGVQFKLDVGTSNDPYEEEADEMADKVMTMPEEGVHKKPDEEEEKKVQTKTNDEEEKVRKKCDECEEEEKVQMKTDEEEKNVQAKEIKSGVNENINSSLAEPVTTALHQVSQPVHSIANNSVIAEQVTQKKENDEEEVQRDMLDDIGSAAGAAWEATGGAAAEAASGFFWDTLEEFAPSAVPILREISNKGIIGFLYDKIKGAFSSIFSGFGLDGTVIDGVIDMYKGLLEQAMVIVTALVQGDCQPLFAAMDNLKIIVQQMATEAWDAITNFFQPVGEFFSNLWTNFGAPVIDWISEAAGDVWDFITGIGKQIWEWTQPIRDSFSDAWDWVKDTLGLNESEDGDEGGIMSWISEKANQAWESIKVVLEPVIAPIRAVYDKVMEILPMEAIMNLRQTVTEWLNNIASMANTMGADGGNVAEEQASLKNDILPAVLITVNNLRDNLVGAGAWVSEKIGSLSSVVTGFMDSLSSNELLSPAAGAIQWLSDKVNSLASWAQSTVVDLFTWIGDGLVYLSKFIEPVLNALQKIADVLGDLLGKLPDFLMGPIWWILPECIKNPIKDFFLNVIIKNIPIIGDIVTALPDIWAKIKNTVMRILRQIFVDGNILGALWTYYSALLEVFGIPPKLVLSILAKAATAFADIITNPIGFMINLLKALKQGFELFFSNIGKNLLTGFADWLFGEVSEAGLQPPADFSFKSIFNFVLQILDITLERIFKRMEEHPKIGPEIVKKLRTAVNFLTGAWEWVAVLINEGPAGLWRFIQEKLADLWQSVITSVIGWITTKVIEKATVWLLSLLDVTGIMPVINSLIAIYKAIESFFQYLKEMLEIVNTVLDGIVGIAKGAFEIAAGFVEKALVKSIPIVLGFLANQFGLGNLSKKIQEMVEKVREKVDKAIDWLLDKAINLGSAILKGLKSAGAAVKEGLESLIEWWKEKREFKTTSGQTHKLFFKGEDTTAVLMVASDTPTPVESFLESKKATDTNANTAHDYYTNTVKKKEEDVLAKEKVYKDLGSDKKEEKRAARYAHQLAVQELRDNMKIFADKLAVVAFDDENLKARTVVHKTQAGNRAKNVTAWPLTYLPGSEVGSAPMEDPTGWKNYAQDSSEQWVRGHLLSEHLHGPGKKWNLVPMIQVVNSGMAGVESTVIPLAKEQGKLHYFSATASYDDSRTTPDEKAIPTSISVVWGELNKVGTPGEEGAKNSTNNAGPFNQDLPKFGGPPNLNTTGRDTLINKGIPSSLAQDIGVCKGRFVETSGGFIDLNDLIDKMEKYYDDKLTKKKKDDELPIKRNGSLTIGNKNLLIRIIDLEKKIEIK